MRLKLSLIAAIIAALVVVGAADARNQVHQSLKRSNNALQFFDNHSWMLAKRHDKCWTVPWSKTCSVARKLYAQHTANVTILDTDNWTRAMRYVQRPFPRTYDWLEMISGRECRACYTVPGGFVCNTEGSGACGPVQFMSGTFYGYAGGAKAFIQKLGFRVKESVWNWRNPLGQALVAAYMRHTDQDGCHWCSSE